MSELKMWVTSETLKEISLNKHTEFDSERNGKNVIEVSLSWGEIITPLTFEFIRNECTPRVTKFISSTSKVRTFIGWSIKGELVCEIDDVTFESMDEITMQEFQWRVYE